MAQKFRNYCFTYYCPNNGQGILTELFHKKGYRYMIFEEETCPKTGRKHWQGALCLKNQRAFTSVVKDLAGWHLEVCKGTIEENIAYCSKEGGQIELGERPSQGKRTDLDTLKDEVMSGRSVDDICVENPNAVHQYGRTLDRLEDISQSKKFRTKEPMVHWFINGSLKDRNESVFSRYNPETDYVWMKGTSWQDGYTGQKNLIISELNGEIPISMLLELMSAAPVFLQRKYRKPIPFTSKQIWITSEKCPLEIYNTMSTAQLRELGLRATVLDLAQKCSEGNTKSSEPEGS